MREELDMLFLLEHFSLEDLVKAEEEYVNYQCRNTDNIAESYTDIEEYIDDECTTAITTKKNILIAVLVLVVLILAGVCVYQNDTISRAKAYINDLENDFPEYIDTTSGSDAYSDWYERVN